MTSTIYVNTPAIIFGFLLDISYIFIYSYINIKKYNGKINTIFIGIGGFFGSVFIEGLIISLLTKVFGEKSYIITGLSLLFPGIFEETGRLLCFKYFLSKEKEKVTAISYGIGHGAFESFIVGLSTLTNAFMKDALINQGVIKEDITFLIVSASAFERFVCVFIQISLSVIVFKAIREYNIKFYLLAIVLHDFIDFFAFLYQRGILSNIYVVELIIGICSLLISRFAYKLYINLEDEMNPEIQNNDNALKERNEMQNLNDEDKIIN